MSNLILRASTTGGELFACVDPSARFCEARLDTTRFSATLTPFRDVAAAHEAFAAAGATNIREWRK